MWEVEFYHLDLLTWKSDTFYERYEKKSSALNALVEAVLHWYFLKPYHDFDGVRHWCSLEVYGNRSTRGILVQVCDNTEEGRDIFYMVDMRPVE